MSTPESLSRRSVRFGTGSVPVSYTHLDVYKRQEENAALANAYKAKYQGAFEEAAPGEVMESNEFLVIDLGLLRGWIFDKENPEVPIGQGEIAF